MNIMPRIDTTTQPWQNRELLLQALHALKNTTGLDGKIVTAQANRQLAREVDAIIEINGAGETHRYTVEIKRVDRFAALGAIKHQIEHYDPPGLLIAPRIAPDTADRCRDLHIPFIDAAGNTYLPGKGQFAFVKGMRLPADDPPAGAGPRAGTATALRVIFALLCNPALLNAPYREIVQAAGVALGAVGWVFFDLQGRGLITGGARKRDRRFLEPKKLFDEWVTNYPIKLRTKLNAQRFAAAEADWWQKIDLTQCGALWGGEVAADRLTRYLKPAQFTLYVRPENDRANRKRLITRNRLRADPKGDIEILDTFWNLPATDNAPDIVPPILAYADLVATLDPRNLDAARRLYDQHIADAYRRA